MSTTTLYETDFYAWTQAQAVALQQADFDQLDITHLIEEIEDMGKSQQRQLESRLIVLLVHLLKWQFQPSKRSTSWDATIRIQRLELVDLLADNSSLRPRLPQVLERAWPKARQGARGETGLELKIFPTSCPYTLSQIFDEAFFPESAQSG